MYTRLIHSILGFAVLCFSSFSSSPASAQSGGIGVKNYRQIVATLYRVTGLRTSDVELQALQQRVASRLPLNGAIEEISSGTILALTELTAGFCKKLIDADALLPDNSRRAHRGVSFTGGPSSLNATLRRSLIQQYATIFWQRSPTQQEMDTLNAGFDMAVLNAPNDAAELRRVLRVACTSVASSIDTLLY